MSLFNDEKCRYLNDEDIDKTRSPLPPSNGLLIKRNRNRYSKT